MKVFKGKISDDGKIIPLSQKEKNMPIILNDKKLQDALNHYLKLKNTEEYLISKQELLNGVMFLSGSWQEVCKSLALRRRLLNSYIIVLDEDYKSFLKLKDTDKLSFNEEYKRDFFIKLLTSYEEELIKYDLVIERAEKLKRHLTLKEQNTR